MNRPAETRPAEPDFDCVPDRGPRPRWSAAALAVCLPALVVAVPLGHGHRERRLAALARRGRPAPPSPAWSSWPAGGTPTGTPSTPCGPTSVSTTRSGPSSCSPLVPLGVAGGILAAPLLPALLHHRNEHEATRHYRELSQERRSRTQAQRAVGRAGPGPSPTGGPSSASPSAGHPELAARSPAAAGHRGAPRRLAPPGPHRRRDRQRQDGDRPHLGRRGPPRRVGRLLDRRQGRPGHRPSVPRPRPRGRRRRPGRHPRAARRLAGRPRSDRQPAPRHPGLHRALLRRHRPHRPAPRRRRPATPLVRRARRPASTSGPCSGPPATTPRPWRPSGRSPTRTSPASGPATTGSPGPSAPPSTAPGPTKTPEPPTSPSADPRTATRPPKSAPSSSRTSSTGPSPASSPHRQALVIVDEFSKLSDRPGAAVDLVERARSFNVAVVLIAQTWASLGPDDTIRNRLAGTVGTVIAHQLKQPDEVAALAGTEWVLERTEQTQTLDHTGLGSQRAGNRYVVHPDDIRRLHQGEAFIIHGGQALKLRVRPPQIETFGQGDPEGHDW